MNGWENASLHHYGTSHSGGGAGDWLPDPWWAAVPPPPEPEGHDYEAEYLAWWEEQVALGLIEAPNDWSASND